MKAAAVKILLLGLGVIIGTHLSAAEPELLAPERAFAMSTQVRDGAALVSWRVAPGYFMYRHRFKFSLDGVEVPLEAVSLPRGEHTVDEIFGEVEVLRDTFTVSVPLGGLQAVMTELTVTSQGCADIGVCYPPQTRNVSLDLGDGLGWSGGGGVEGAFADVTGALALVAGAQQSFLPPELAFVLSTRTADDGSIITRWEIADGYYLYRQKINATVVQPAGYRVERVETPPGLRRTDEYFGDVEVYYDEAEARISLSPDYRGGAGLVLDIGYQGCADAGLCYPPLTKRLPLDSPGGSDAAARELSWQGSDADGELSSQDRIARSLSADNLLWSLTAFFGFGLLLTFTPCVLPMVPILSGIIIGEGKRLTNRRAFALSAVYVLAMALTYSLAGVAAGLLGGGLQAAFQNPWVIGVFSAVFVVLAGSMFGWYELALPGGWQSALSAVSNRQKGGSYLGVAAMGVLSALIVGPCVAAPLAGALIYIGQTGDAVLGGAALFALSLGMGVPLLVIGTSAGRLLPRVGAWMESIKAVFGFVLLGVAVYLLERIVPAWVNMLLWSALLIGFALYHAVWRRPPVGASGWQRAARAGAVVSLLYGVLLLAGVSAGATDPLRPWQAFAGVPEHQPLEFKRVADLNALASELKLASSAGNTAMLDYYADWCISCKEMEKYTFSDEAVREALGNTVLLQVDVTRHTDDDRALLEAFGLYGPPAILFFGADGVERPRYRLVGFVPAGEFSRHVRDATSR